MQTDGYRESGGFAALSAALQRLSTTSTTTGLRVQAGTHHGVINAMLGWRHTFGDTQTVSRMAFEGGQEFSVQGTPIARDAALVELGGALSLGKRSTLSVTYNGQLAKHAKEHAGRVTLRVRF
jgi:fibronectin-binding autotransporter adhesin